MSVADNEEEFLEIYNEKGEQTGKKVIRKTAHEKGIYHAVTHCWICTKNGNLLLQKRSKKKKSHPNVYDASSAGHITFGDIPIESQVKELKEELGMDFEKSQLKFVGKWPVSTVTNNGKYIDNEFHYVYAIEVDKIELKSLKLQESEVGGVAVCHYSEVKRYTLEKNKKFFVYDPNTDFFKGVYSYFDKKYGITIPKKGLLEVLDIE